MNQINETPVRSDTKERILDAAERLFAEQGFAGTSLRQITTEAEVNLAAVNYHFHSKESLVSAVLGRKMGPANARRSELLDQVLREAGTSQPAIEELLRAFLQPIFEARAAGVELSCFPRLMARLASDSSDWAAEVMSTHLKPVLDRFWPAFDWALGGVPRYKLAWAIHYCLGAMAHSLAGPPLILRFAESGAPELDQNAQMKQLITYMAGGLRALAEKEPGQ